MCLFLSFRYWYSHTVLGVVLLSVFVVHFLTSSMNLGHPVVSCVHGSLRPWRAMRREGGKEGEERKGAFEGGRRKRGRGL